MLKTNEAIQKREKARAKVKAYKDVCCYSKKSAIGFDTVENNCFATWNDYKNLEQKYLKLHHRYKREVHRRPTTAVFNAYVKAINEIDDKFEYSNESVKDRATIKAILTKLTNKLSKLLRTKK